MYLSSYVNMFCYFSINETEWSMQMMDDIVSNDWECSNCGCTYNLTGIQKLQHKMGKNMTIILNCSENHLWTPGQSSCELVLKQMELDMDIEQIMN